MALSDDVISQYLPDYKECRPYNREFLFTLINSIKPEFFPSNINDALNRRKQKQIEKSFNEVVI